MRHHIQRHKYKIVVGVPMAVLLASSLSVVRGDPAELCLVPEDTSYVEVGEVVTLNVTAQADEPINVIGGTITVPSDLMEITAVSREQSIIDLWSEEPALVGNTVHFSGGILREGGFSGSGIVLTLTARMLAEGKATVSIDDTSMLAHDGTGRPVSCGVYPMVLSIRPQEHPTPDVNGDNSVDLYDFGLVSARLFMSYNKLYDLNLDGRISLADIGIIISNMGRGNGEQSSLALLAR